MSKIDCIITWSVPNNSIEYTGAISRAVFSAEKQLRKYADFLYRNKDIKMIFVLGVDTGELEITRSNLIMGLPIRAADVFHIYEFPFEKGMPEARMRELNDQVTQRIVNGPAKPAPIRREVRPGGYYEKQHNE